MAEIRCEGSGAWHPLDPSWVPLPAEYRRPPKHCIWLHHVHGHVSHHHVYEVWNDFATRCLYTLKSGDKLISLKETYEPCEGRAEQHLLHHCETDGTCNVE